MRLTLNWWNLSLMGLVLNFYLLFASCTWPTLNSSSVQLLGLFPDDNKVNGTNFSVHSRAMFKAAILLSKKYDIKINDEYIDGRIGQTGGTSIGAISSTCTILSKSNVVGIVGPAFSRETAIMIEYGDSIGIPIISYAATDPHLSDRHTYQNFYRTVPSDSIAASAILNLFLRFNWTDCIIIYQNDQYGSGFFEAISNLFNTYNLSVVKTIVFDISTSEFSDDLQHTLKNSPTRIVILWTHSKYIPDILRYAISADILGPSFTWILSSTISFDSFDPKSHSSLIGLLSIESVAGSGVDASINTTLLNEAYQLWRKYEPETFPESMDVDYYALFAFDATWTLIQSLQKHCLQSVDQSSLCAPLANISSCYDSRYSKINSFLNIVDTMNFLGVSGAVKFNENTTDRVGGIYYLIKNAQPVFNRLSFVPVLKWSQTENWKEFSQNSIVIWPGNSLTVPNSYKSLAGVLIRLCYVEAKPFTMRLVSENNETKYSGYIPDFVNYLINRTRFIPLIKLLPNGQTYYQHVQDVANGVCDMLIGDITITAKRREIVDFSTSIFDNSLSILVRKTDAPSIAIFGFLRPFTLSLWLTFLAAIFFGGLLFFLVERSENQALRHQSFISSLAMSLWFSFGTVLGYGVDFHVRTAAGRMLTLGLYILSLISVAAYVANLASYLTVLKQQGSISGLDDILSKKISLDRIGLVEGSSIEEFYLRVVSQGIPNYYHVNSSGNLAIDLINGRIDAVMWNTPFLQYVSNNEYCNLTIVGPDFSRNSYGIAIPKQWIYRRDLDIAILSLREAGIVDKLRQQWFSNNICGDSNVSSVDSFGVESLIGLFVIFEITCILAMVLFAWNRRFQIEPLLWLCRARNDASQANAQRQSFSMDALNMNS